MFKDSLKNTDVKIRQSAKVTTEPVELTQSKRQQKKPQKRQLAN